MMGQLFTRLGAVLATGAALAMRPPRRRPAAPAA